jgi:sugar lactone lactonase YvrE
MKPSSPYARRVLLLSLLSALPAAAQTDSISLPESLWGGDSLTWVRKVPFYCEGPAWEPATGYVYFTQQIGNNAPNWPVWRIRPGSDTGSVWYNSYQNNGLAFDREGRLIAAQNGRLSRLTWPNIIPVKNMGNGGPPDTATLVLSGTNGVTFGQANDLTIHSDGSIFFTALGSAVYYRDPQGQLFTATNSGATVNGANGIERLPSEPNALYVNATNGNSVYRYDIGANGSLSNRTTFISGITQPDGGTYDTLGNRYVASYGGGEVRVYDKTGVYLGRIALRRQSGIYDSVASSGRIGRQGNASNAVFGGADMKTLFITGDGGLFSLRLKVPGRHNQLVGSAIHPGLKKAWRNGPAGALRDARGRALPEDASKKPGAIRVPAKDAPKKP